MTSVRTRTYHDMLQPWCLSLFDSGHLEPIDIRNLLCIFQRSQKAKNRTSKPMVNSILVGGLEPWNFEWLSIQLGMSSQPTFTPSFFRGGQPPTSNDSRTRSEFTGNSIGKSDPTHGNWDWNVVQLQMDGGIFPMTPMTKPRSSQNSICKSHLPPLICEVPHSCKFGGATGNMILGENWKLGATECFCLG